MNARLFRVLPGLPGYGPLPMGFSPDGHGLHREGYVIEFLPDAPAPWIGNFQPGYTQLDTAIEYPDSRHVLVIAHGQGYLVDPISRRLVRVLGPDTSLVLPLMDRHQLLLGTDLWLELVGTNGPVWRTRRISWDGMQQVRREGNQVKGQAWSPVDDRWHDFVLDLNQSTPRFGHSWHFGGLSIAATTSVSVRKSVWFDLDSGQVDGGSYPAEWPL